VSGGRGYVAAVPSGPVLPASPDHDTWMERAIDQARTAAAAGEVPIGAVVVQPDIDGSAAVVAARHNERESSADPTAHAEVLAIRDAAHALGRWRLDDCLLVVTLEPCPMCAGALWAARIGGVVFGAENFDAGALGTLYHLGQDPRLNHEFPVRAGVRHETCAELLRTFFSERRP
jgi:tRNA(adenine34) deaminase